jgi:hypothetical protein
MRNANKIVVSLKGKVCLGDLSTHGKVITEEGFEGVNCIHVNSQQG